MRLATLGAFNLSILECKCVQRGCNQAYGAAFNLSILECKYMTTWQTLGGALLLISPYWNVNQAA